jgi:predicted RNase H-like HicB family nuclease
MKTTYRGYTIFYYSAGGWLGFVYPPSAVKATGETEEATKGEGEEVLLNRAKARIDAELRPKKKTPAIDA